jgi:hypothetical protein
LFYCTSSGRDFSKCEGKRLGRIAAIVTKQGILPLDHGNVGGRHLEHLRPLFAEYLLAWSAHAGLPLLLSTRRTAYYWPDLLPVPPGAEAVDLEIDLPGYGTGRRFIFMDVMATSPAAGVEDGCRRHGVEAPGRYILPVLRLLPPRAGHW